MGKKKLCVVAFFLSLTLERYFPETNRLVFRTQEIATVLTQTPKELPYPLHDICFEMNEIIYVEPIVGEEIRRNFLNCLKHQESSFFIMFSQNSNFFPIITHFSLFYVQVAWIKADTKAILAIHEHVITNNARLSVTHNDFNTWTLNIRGVKREDRGQYMCQVNTDPMKMQTAYLEVVIPPDIIYEETSGDMMVPEGGSAKLACKARGHPKPRIVWKREDGGPIVARHGMSNNSGKVVERLATVEGEMLTLTKVTRSEMGAYLCIAANGVPPSVSKRMMLHVHFHPLIQVPNQLVGAPINTDVTLQCHVEASPKAINYWTRDTGEMIISNDKYQMSEITNPYYTVQMKLIIHKFQKSDLGGYKCISKNSIGDAEGNIRLYEMELQDKIDINDDILEEEQDENNENRSYNGFQGPLTETEDNSQQPNMKGGTATPIFAKITRENNVPRMMLLVICHISLTWLIALAY